MKMPPRRSATFRRATPRAGAIAAQPARTRNRRPGGAGFKNKEMAEKMFISEQTVKNHLHNIFDKLGVSDRLELALYAIHNNCTTAASVLSHKFAM